jgi:hypothetical protein
MGKSGQGFTLQATSAGQDPATTDEFGVADLSAADIQWHRNSADFGSVDLAYTVEVAEALPGATLAVYGANGTSLDNREQAVRPSSAAVLAWSSGHRV